MSGEEAPESAAMPFADIVTILTDLYLDFAEDPEWKQWMRANYLGVSMAVLIYNNAATPTELGIVMVEKSWVALVEHLGLDVQSRWGDLYGLLDAAGINA